MRIDAAKKLEQWGWSVVRYAQRVQRHCAKPTDDNAKSASMALWKCKFIWSQFVVLRNEARGVHERSQNAGEA